ncbi:hypothetical protein [Streptomyces fagopyri]|uniref:hypothetical protein n=1 Tax=Streptomyces fagopyri TaxID=2662397 RepID=UPI00371F7DFD
MTSFVLPHEVHGDGAHQLIAVHGRSAGRSAYTAALPGLDRAAFPYMLVDPRGHGEEGDVRGALDPALSAVPVRETSTRGCPGSELHEPARTGRHARDARDARDASPLDPIGVVEPFPRAAEADADRAGSEA